MKEYVQIEKQDYINLLVTIENLTGELNDLYNSVLDSATIKIPSIKELKTNE